MTIQSSTKVCSFGKQVVEKLETEYARYENGRYVYKIQASPMCEYMINFISKLKSLPETYMKDSVLENFTILQVRTLQQPYNADLISCNATRVTCVIGGNHCKIILQLIDLFSDCDKPRHPRNATVHRLRVPSVDVGTRRPASHLQTGQGLTCRRETTAERWPEGDQETNRRNQQQRKIEL